MTIDKEAFDKQAFEYAYAHKGLTNLRCELEIFIEAYEAAKKPSCARKWSSI